MGYSYERGAAARNLLRARAHGHERVISDAETLAWEFLGSDYGENGDVEMEEYIADHYADFTPEPPVITDDMVERAAREMAGLEPGESWPSNIELGGSLTGTRDDEHRAAWHEEARAALEAALGAKKEA